MSTLKQKKTIKKLVENGGNATEAMRAAGYAEATANNPSNFTDSKGFKALLKASGLDETLVIQALVEDIRNKPNNRIRELSLAAEPLGMRKQASTIEIESGGMPIPILHNFFAKVPI